MDQELVFTVEDAKAVGALPISFADAGLKERDHLQEWILANPQILGGDLMVVSSEYDGFESSEGTPIYDRLDVLAIDRSGRLVIAELKRDRAQSAVTMQALNYAAMMSRFSLDEVGSVFAKHQRKQGRDVEDPLLELREWAPEISDETLGPPAIILVAGDFVPQVTNTAMFLFENGIDIRSRPGPSLPHSGRPVGADPVATVACAEGRDVHDEAAVSGGDAGGRT